MPVSKNQLQRLIRLVARLKKNRYPNCKSFAEELRKSDLDENVWMACTDKTVFRDILTLKNEFKAPIAFDRGRNGYYLKHHGWTFNAPYSRSEEELLTAVLGARLAENIFPEPLRTQIRDSVDFMLSSDNPDFLDKAQIDSLVIIPGMRKMPDPATFMTLFKAWQEHELVSIDYEDASDALTTRRFEPHTVIFYEGLWYTKGFCHLRKEPRTLVLHRVKAIKRLGKYFEPDPAIIKTATESEIFSSETVYDVNILCDGYLKKRVEAKPLHLAQTVKKVSKTRFRITVPEISRYRLVTWIMRQCGNAVITHPPELVAEIKDFARKILKEHRNEINCKIL